MRYGRLLMAMAIGGVGVGSLATMAQATDQPQDVIVYVSSTSSGTVDGINFKNEDVLAYDSGADTWAMHFDGSDVGLSGSDIDALHVLSDGNVVTLDPILMSLEHARTIGGLTFDDSDIVMFTPSALGTTTAGTFTMFLDGSDAGLNSNSEDVDAIAFTPGGDLVVSTVGVLGVPREGGGGLNGRDEDLIVRRASGDWDLYFDGSDVSLTKSTEDVWGAWIDPSVAGTIYLTTKDEFSVPGSPVNPLTGDQEDLILFSGAIGSTTSGTFADYWDGDTHRIAGERLDGISLEFRNESPDAVDDGPYTTDQETVLAVPDGVTDLLANDSDPDGDPIAITELNGAPVAFGVPTAIGSGAVVTLAADGSFQYDPNNQFDELDFSDSAGDSFTYTIADIPGGSTASATVSLTVVGLNDPPMAEDDTDSTDELTAISTDVLANDTDVDGDDSPSSFGIDSIGSVVVAGLSIDPNLATGSVNISSGEIAFDPGSDFVELDSSDSATVTVGYTMSDGNGGTDSASLVIAISGLNGAPVVTVSGSSSTFVSGGAPVTVDGAITVTDADDTTLASATVTITNLLDIGDEILVATPSGGIGAGDITYAAPILTIAPAGGASVANFATVLQSVTYENTSGPPTTTDRTVNFKANDGAADSNVAAVTVGLTVDQAPTVTSTTPADTAIDVATDSNLSVTFSEAVTIAGDWFEIICASSGTYNPTGSGGATVVTVTDADPTFTLNPAADFDGGEPCTVTVVAAQVTDDDAVDPPDNMASDFVFGFATAGAAIDDAYNSTGNVGITVSEADGVILGLGADQGVGLGVSEVQGLAGNVGNVTATTNGTVTVAANGSFTYASNGGYTGADTFTYRVSAGGGDSNLATVTITIADMIWFVDNDAGTTGDGTLGGPFDELGDLGALDAVGDCIFVADGTGSYGAITLLNQQILVGDGSTSTLAGVCEISLAAHSNSLPTFTGTNPTLTNVSLASDNTVRGLGIGASSGTALSGGDVDALSISEVDTVSNTGGPAVEINGGTSLSVAIGAASSSGGSTGIDLTNSTGTFTFDTVTVTNIGGTGFAAVNAGTVNVTNGASTVNSTSGRAVEITGTNGSISFASLSSASPPGSGVRLDTTNITFAVSGTTSITNRGGTGMEFNAVSGTVGFGATTVSNAGGATGDGVRLDSSAATFTFDALNVDSTVVGITGTYSATTGVPTNDGDGNGIFIKNHSGSVAINGGSITDFADNAVDIRASSNVALNGVTIDANFAGNSAIQGHNVFNFTFDNSTIDELDNTNAAALVGDHGLRFIELEGTLRVVGSEITDVEGYVHENASSGSDNRAIEVQNRQGCTVQDGTGDCNITAFIDDLTVRNFDFQGVNIRHVGGTSNITVQNSDFDFVNGAAVNTGPNQAASTNTHTVLVHNNTFDNVGIAAELFSSRGGPTVSTVTSNVITGTHSDGIRIIAFNQAGAGTAASHTSTVSGNTLTGVAGNNVTAASGGAGIFIAAEDGVDAQVLVENNSITGHTNGAGLVAECFRTQNQRNGVLDVVFRGNSCTDFPTNFFGAVLIGNDNDTSSPFTDTCVDFAASNSYSNTNGLFANTFETDSTGSSILNLPNGFNANLTLFPQLDFGNPPGSGACSIAPLL